VVPVLCLGNAGRGVVLRRGLLAVGRLLLLLLLLLLLHVEALELLRSELVVIDCQRVLVSRTSYWACNRQLTSRQRRRLAGERVDSSLGAVRLEPRGFRDHCSVGKPELCLRSCRLGRGCGAAQ
jgi:hypothetical protein